jgi:bifunctional non-homologous end joining protein LigD
MVMGKRITKLEAYKAKRDFSVTGEPKGGISEGSGNMYVVQEHHASRLHYDLRLERDGVLKSWAVPKGVPEALGDKRLAIEVEDHPLEYAAFEGSIPEGEYGAGTVSVWDKGSYDAIAWSPDAIEIHVKGERVNGRYVLTRFKKAGDKAWLLFRAKEKTG